MESYREMRARQQAEVNALPLGYAYGDKQFAEMMSKWGLEPTDTDKIYKLGVPGCFYQRKDSDVIKATFDRHTKEFNDAIESDITGEDFIYQMFVDELFDHEYSYTYDSDDAIYACGFTSEEVFASEKLSNALNKACNYVMSCDI